MADITLKNVLEEIERVENELRPLPYAPGALWAEGYWMLPATRS